MEINFICDTLLSALDNAGYHEHTIFNYKGVVRRFKAFCKNKGITEYTPDFGQTYAEDVISIKTGKFSKNRYHTQGRFIRLLNSYYSTGAFDFATLKRGKMEPSNYKHIQIYHNYSAFLQTKYTSENTIHFYEYELYYFLQYLNKIMVLDIEVLSPSIVIDYLKYTKQCRHRAVLCGLRLFLKYINRNDLFASIEGIHAFRSKRIIPTLTDEEKEQIKDTIESGKATHRDAAIVLLGLSSGIRACDLINLKLSDIDWINETISFKQSKTGNTVCLPLTTSVGNAIARYISEERPKTNNDFLFVRQLAPFDHLSDHASCYYVVSRLFKQSKISKDKRIFGMHMLRHNAASTMVKNEVPIATIAAILGHSNTDTTDIYITTDESRLKDCVLPMIGISTEVNP
ncbi:MAG: tyrosine-type recombinase/integrase [Sedimentibacter sp.]